MVSCLGSIAVADCVAIRASSLDANPMSLLLAQPILVTAVSSANLVEEFVHGLADTLQPEDLCHREIRIGDIPAFRRDLVLDEVILCAWTANAGPAVPRRVND